MSTNLDIIRATYEGSSEENGRNLLAVLAPNATWTEAAGFPYAGTYVGPEQIISGVFQRLSTEWEDYSAKVHTYLADGDKVAAFGVYSGMYRKTGKTMRASFAHLYRIKEGKILSMEQFVDSHLVQQALLP
ncbi:nuclear transport factor 2 family protein [Comamonas sp. NoAH]|uniref:nuclear transport factor 2 family protein n=1 Tax=Comamonas halotolerans TaxID=3041496 RepID=UPI0024E18CB4|nr:nuclear transport factor 2 family protein [Comamonas sp. NoAH]